MICPGMLALHRSDSPHETKLMISNEEMHDIMRIVKFL